jgi:hypothetical protein
MNITKFFTALAVTAWAGASFTSCDDNMYQPEETVRAERVELGDEFANGFQAVIGESFIIAGKVTVVPVETTDKMESFSSSNPGVATVDEAGKVVARSEGTTTITITVDGQSTLFTLTVLSRIAYDVTAIEPIRDTFEPDVNQVIDIFAKLRLTPVTAESLDLEFTSSNSPVATVDETGSVTGKSAGHATITVTSRADPSVRVTLAVDVFAVNPDFTVTDGIVTAYGGPGGNLRVPGTATSIANGVFRNNATITSIHLNNVETLGTSTESYVFGACSALTRMVAPNLATVWGNCFNGCTNLVEVVGDKLTALKNAAFQGCTKLETINLESVTELGQFAFQATALRSVYMPSITSITNRRRQFGDCPELVSVDMPNLTLIGADMVFQNCPKLKDVNLPKLETLMLGSDQGNDNQLFENCTSLVQVSLPSIKNLNNLTFNGCTALTRIDLSRATGLAVLNGTFMPNSYSGVTIYVASDAIKALFPSTATYTVTVGSPPAS